MQRFIALVLCLALADARLDALRSQIELAASDSTQACPAGYGNCDNNAATGTSGCETFLRSSTATKHCGGCNIPCGINPPFLNGFTSCATGVCTLTGCGSPSTTPAFPWPYGNCDGNAANGCETPLNTLTNCKICGGACPVRPNSSGVCQYNSVGCNIICHSGWGNCDGVKTNGCEVSLTASPNCGACGRVCYAPSQCRPPLVGQTTYNCRV